MVVATAPCVGVTNETAGVVSREFESAIMSIIIAVMQTTISAPIAHQTQGGMADGLGGGGGGKGVFNKGSEGRRW
jgi:hypothetical protein